jgi:hypothetical protein
MQHENRWFLRILFLIIIMSFAACNTNKAAQTKIEPAIIEENGDGEFKRIVLTEKAAQRLNLQTMEVREEQIKRTQTFGGQVMAVSNDPSAGEDASGELLGTLLRIPVSETDLTMVDQDQPAYILPATGSSTAPGLMAQPVDATTVINSQVQTNSGTQPNINIGENALYYLINPVESGFIQGQGVFAELSLLSDNTPRKIIPYAAVLYGVHGETWVYTNPEPLAFIRTAITVDYIEDDLAILLEGPEVGTPVVTVGAAELFGTETGVSK